jgi:dUTP pyrophosphatase
MSLQLRIKKLSENAVLPKVEHEGDAGFDLYTTQTTVIAPGERKQIPTGIAMEIPDGYVGLIWEKSGLSHKAGLKTLGGVIDSGYRGEVLVGVINLSDGSYTFETGHKVAQMIIQKIEKPEIVEVHELSETKRGGAGFGSTGK